MEIPKRIGKIKRRSRYWWYDECSRYKNNEKELTGILWTEGVCDGPDNSANKCNVIMGLNGNAAFLFILTSFGCSTAVPLAIKWLSGHQSAWEVDLCPVLNLIPLLLPKWLIRIFSSDNILISGVSWIYSHFPIMVNWTVN